MREGNTFYHPEVMMALKLTEGHHEEKIGEALLTYSVMTERGEVELRNISVPSRSRGEGRGNASNQIFD